MGTDRKSEPVVAGPTRRRCNGGTRMNHHAAAADQFFDGGDTGADLADAPIIFAAMPFDPAYDDVFFVAVRAAARAAGGRAVRVDQVMHAADAVLETERLLRQCSVVVADLSTNEADVLYEVGYARAIGTPVVQICAATHDSLPFMVRNNETLLYEPGRTYLLIDALAPYLKSVFSRLGERETTND